MKLTLKYNVVRTVLKKDLALILNLSIVRTVRIMQAQPPGRMDKTNLSQDGIGRSLLELFYRPFSGLMTRQVSDRAFALGAQACSKKGSCVAVLPWSAPYAENLAQPCRGHSDKCFLSWQPGGSPEELDAGPNLRSYKMTFGPFLGQSVRDAGKGSPCDYWRKRSRKSKHFMPPWRRRSSQ
jgi:hypothetical protein